MDGKKNQNVARALDQSVFVRANATIDCKAMLTLVAVEVSNVLLSFFPLTTAAFLDILDKVDLF